MPTSLPLSFRLRNYTATSTFPRCNTPGYHLSLCSDLDDEASSLLAKWLARDDTSTHTNSKQTANAPALCSFTPILCSPHHGSRLEAPCIARTDTWEVELIADTCSIRLLANLSPSHQPFVRQHDIPALLLTPTAFYSISQD